MRDSIKSIRPRKTVFEYALKRDNNFKNHKKVYVVENEEGVFCTAKRIHVSIQFQLNDEEETTENA